MKSDTPPPTRALSARAEVFYIRRFAASVVDGVDRGKRVVSATEELTVGTEDGNDMVLADGSVSRHHCTLRATDRGLEVRDLGSTNGTHVGGLEVITGIVANGTRLQIGRTTVAVEILDDEIEEPLGEGDRFGNLYGASTPMRRLYPLLERFAQSSATVLLGGETGTGKEIAAEALHSASPRKSKPFVVVDCGALPRQLLESELFGHVRGAFTGAHVDREGAFEAADGGTIFLDEIGELALDLQPVLLRVLEGQTVRRVGSDERRQVDVRVIAATHRDLRVDVNEKRFRADLFFRLNVLGLVLPPLRDRGEDVAYLAKRFWKQFRPGTIAPAEFLASLATQRWPGNVRELRNWVERSALLGWTSQGAKASNDSASAEDAQELSFGQAKEQAMAQWETGFVRGLLQENNGNLSRAARAAQMSRSHLRLLLGRHGLDRQDYE